MHGFQFLYYMKFTFIFEIQITFLHQIHKVNSLNTTFPAQNSHEKINKEKQNVEVFSCEFSGFR